VKAVTDRAPRGFAWDFIDEIVWWALGIAGAAAAVAAIAFDDVAFALGCVVAASVDLVLVRVASGRARRGLARGEIDNAAPIIMVAGRLLAKAGLLLLSIAVPTVLGFAGTVVGVLVFDLTLALVGSIKAAARTMRPSKRGRVRP
jgi:hypothetical protein